MYIIVIYTLIKTLLEQNQMEIHMSLIPFVR